MTQCRQCKGLITWVRSGERWLCHNPDGSDHWDTCSARRWKQVQATGQRFEGAQVIECDRLQIASGYANSIHGTKFSRLATPARKGKAFRQSGNCKACVPPWVACPECPDRIERKAA